MSTKWNNNKVRSFLKWQKWEEDKLIPIDSHPYFLLFLMFFFFHFYFFLFFVLWRSVSCQSCEVGVFSVISFGVNFLHVFECMVVSGQSQCKFRFSRSHTKWIGSKWTCAQTASVQSHPISFASISNDTIWSNSMLRFFSFVQVDGRVLMNCYCYIHILNDEMPQYNLVLNCWVDLYARKHVRTTGIFGQNRQLYTFYDSKKFRIHHFDFEAINFSHWRISLVKYLNRHQSVFRLHRSAEAAYEDRLSTVHQMTTSLQCRKYYSSTKQTAFKFITITQIFDHQFSAFKIDWRILRKRFFFFVFLFHSYFAFCCECECNVDVRFDQVVQIKLHTH